MYNSETKASVVSGSRPVIQERNVVDNIRADNVQVNALTSIVGLQLRQPHQLLYRRCRFLLKQFHEAWSRVLGDINSPVEDRLVQELLFPRLRIGDALHGSYYRVQTLLGELHFGGSGPDSGRDECVTIRQWRKVLGLAEEAWSPRESRRGGVWE